MTEIDQTLTVVGDEGDSVNADFSGHAVSKEDHGSFTRYVIDNGAARLDIDNDIQQNVVGDFA